MNYTLKMMKDALYTGPNPVLYARGKNVTEEDFLDLLFSPDFYSKSFQDENGESFSLETILCARPNGGTAQRNKVFTGKYEGFRLELTADSRIPSGRSIEIRYTVDGDEPGDGSLLYDPERGIDLQALAEAAAEAARSRETESLRLREAIRV